MTTRMVCVFASIWIFLGLSSAFAASECAKDNQPPVPPALNAAKRILQPPVISASGDTLWIQVHTAPGQCPGDPHRGHGGEGTGGPGPEETWCFESYDSCGTNPPWDTGCFSHVDVRAQPSEMDINYWHIDAYRTGQRTYCGDCALWCGADSVWDGDPVECGTWYNAPGYGNNWNCCVQLTLPGTFDVANGCTLSFDPRYDTECKYDYFYVDFWDGTAWQTLAAFNATSNNPGPECGSPGGGNPDYWANTDINRLANVDWQERTDPSLPAFSAALDTVSYSYSSGPAFRWRFVSDAAWSDADGRGNTDGGAWIDNVMVVGDSEQYSEDFEGGSLDPAYWSLPDPDGVMDYWYLMHDPDPLYEGGDGGDRNACILDSSVVYRARPLNGYRAPYRNGWFYRLMMPAVPMLKTGAVVQYDEYRCSYESTCDYTATRVRFYNGAYGRWCPWMGYEYWICASGCYFWNFDQTEDVSAWSSVNSDSMQFAWDLKDVSAPGEFCRGHHQGTDFQIDNVSVGFYDRHATDFSTRTIDLLHDMFFTDLCAFSSGFNAYNDDTLEYYAGGAHPLPARNQLNLEIRDEDLIQSVELMGSLDGGAAWTGVPMTMSLPFDPADPDRGGDYYGTLCPGDFGAAEWQTGTEVWYYVKCTDQLDNVEYYPRAADESSPYHTGTALDYFEFSVLPMYPPEYADTKLLLVDGYGRANYDYSPCLSRTDYLIPLEDIYEQTLTDAGYCFDKYDIGGAGSNVHIHYLCDWNSEYDAVVWFTGSYFSNYLFDGEAQRAMRDYLGDGGRVVICGDRAAFNAAPQSEGGAGEDSLGGEFLSGIMGADYLCEMESPFDKPYVYCAGVDSLLILGTPTAIELDTLLVYRQCPYLKDMSYIRTEPSPPAGYYAQPLMTVLNPGVAQADMVTYAEYQGAGRSVLVDFDLSAAANHVRNYCAGGGPFVPPFDAGSYEGRVDLMRLILEDVFGLPPSGGGMAGRGGGPPLACGWRLAQNAPNPCISGTIIKYETPARAHVSISVYDSRGRVVKILADAAVEPGEHSIFWDGRNADGRRVSSGIYFYRMHAGPYESTRKMVVVN
jgi:hypothetical protein